MWLLSIVETKEKEYTMTDKQQEIVHYSLNLAQTVARAEHCNIDGRAYNDHAVNMYHTMQALRDITDADYKVNDIAMLAGFSEFLDVDYARRLYRVGCRLTYKRFKRR